MVRNLEPKTNPAAGPRGEAPPAWIRGHVRAALAWAAELALALVERDRQRRALRELDARQLRDLGLTPADVAGEVRKWIWER